MARIIKFPGPEKGNADRPSSGSAAPAADLPSPRLIRVVWVVAVLLSPLLKWLLALDCVVQLLIALYRWNTSPVLATWTFSLHFGALCVLTYFVSVYRPRGA